MFKDNATSATIPVFLVSKNSEITQPFARIFTSFDKYGILFFCEVIKEGNDLSTATDRAIATSYNNTMVKL